MFNTFNAPLPILFLLDDWNVCLCFLKGSLDKNSKNAGYVLLMFYNLYEGKVCTMDTFTDGDLHPNLSSLCLSTNLTFLH